MDDIRIWMLRNRVSMSDSKIEMIDYVSGLNIAVAGQKVISLKDKLASLV